MANATSWLAWHRPGPRYPWRRMAEGATEAKAFAQSHALALSGDWLIRPAAAGDPNEPPRLRQPVVG